MTPSGRPGARRGRPSGRPRAPARARRPARGASRDASLDDRDGGVARRSAPGGDTGGRVRARSPLALRRGRASAALVATASSASCSARADAPASNSAATSAGSSSAPSSRSEPSSAMARSRKPISPARSPRVRATRGRRGEPAPAPPRARPGAAPPISAHTGRRSRDGSRSGVGLRQVGAESTSQAAWRSCSRARADLANDAYATSRTSPWRKRSDPPARGSREQVALIRRSQACSSSARVMPSASACTSPVSNASPTTAPSASADRSVVVEAVQACGEQSVERGRKRLGRVSDRRRRRPAARGTADCRRPPRRSLSLRRLQAPAGDRREQFRRGAARERPELEDALALDARPQPGRRSEQRRVAPPRRSARARRVASRPGRRAGPGAQARPGARHRAPARAADRAQVARSAAGTPSRCPRWRCPVGAPRRPRPDAPPTPGRRAIRRAHRSSDRPWPAR